MRAILTFVFLMTGTATAAADGDDSEKQFRSLEGVVRSAKTLRLRADVSVNDALGKSWPIKIELTLAEGDAFKADVDGKLFGEPVKFTAVSDGKTLKTTGRGEGARTESTNESAKGVGAYFRRELPSAGLFGCVLNLEQHGRRTPDRLKLADFKSLGKEKLGERMVDAIRFSAVETGAKDPFITRLWLDEKTHLPAKIVIAGGMSDIAEVTEVFQEFSVDATVDPKLLVLPK